MDDSSFSEDSNEKNINKIEIYDSLNNVKKNENKNTINNISLNNEDSVLEEAYESLSKFPKKNEEEKDNKETDINNKNHIDENNVEKINNDKEEDLQNLNINNEEENVNLGISFSKISEKDKDKKNFIEKNNNQEVVTPNTSIYNLSETISKKSEAEINNIEITNKKITNNININENKEEPQITEQIKKKESFNIFDDDSLVYNKKGNLSAVKNYINPNEDDNKLLYNINIQFSKIGKPNENENEQNINNFEEQIINLTDKNIINNNKSKKTKNIILKRFEQIKRNKNPNINIENSNPIKDTSENNNNNIIYNDQATNKISKNFMTNSTKENNYIYLCPFCNKETPEIIKLEGFQFDLKEPTKDKISIICTCGKYDLNLDEFIKKIEEQNEFKNSKDFCYNENHDLIKGINYC